MHVVPKTLKAFSLKLGITGMGFQSAGIGRLYSWDRSSASGLTVLFAGLQALCGGASGVFLGNVILHVFMMLEVM